MIKEGRICMKLAGRDAQTRRRKCNIKHLEPLKQEIDIRKGASHDLVASEFKKLRIEVIEKKSKEKKERPVKKRKVKEKKPETKAEKKKAEKTIAKEEKKAAKEEKKEAKEEKKTVKKKAEK